MLIKPTHYTQYEIEPIAYIKSKKYNFVQGCIVKYPVRYKQKDGLKDLQKAESYCKDLINDLIQKNNQKISTQEFCEKNKLDPRVAKIIELVDMAHITNNPIHLQEALLIIQELQEEYVK